GSNGAGKTTLLRTISGLLRPAAGSIQWLGNGSAASAVHELKPHEIVRLGISHAPEGRQVFANLTLRENLLLGGYQQRSRQQMALTIAHRGYVLQTGRVIKTDTAKNLLADPEVKNAYLGG